MTQRFEWDEAKAATNLRKHGVSFEEAASVFSDALAYTFTDPDHSVGERRLLTFVSRNLDTFWQLFTPSEGEQSESSVPVRQLDMNEVYMNKVKDDMRDEYRRENLGKGVRGKYFERVSKGTNLVLLDDQVAKSFPTAEAVNQALLGLLALTEQTARLTGQSSRTPRKRAAA